MKKGGKRYLGLETHLRLEPLLSLPVLPVVVVMPLSLLSFVVVACCSGCGAIFKLLLP